jgi:prepilin-type N-terminal cleavage/methylation domain-containing protein
MKARHGLNQTGFFTGNHHRGFALMEVLVSVAILSVGITLLLESIITSLDSNRITQEYSRAIFLAETKMWQLEKEYAYKEDMTTGESTGYFDPPFHQFDWETEVQEEDRLVEYHLRVTIRWKHRDRDQEFTVRSLAPMRRNERDLK